MGLFSQLPGSTNAFVSYNLAVDDAGRFTITSPAVAADRAFAADQLGASAGGSVYAAAANVISGTIGADGSVTGTISGVAGAQLSGTKAADTGATQALAGLYQASAALNSATTLAIVSANGQAFALAQTATSADAGLGTVNASGNLAVTTANQATVTGTVAAGTAQLTATVSAGGQNVTYTGASETVLATQRLSSISTRALVGSGAAVTIAGFIIAGQESKTVLIRAVGPTLATLGVSGTLAAPTLDLYLYRGGVNTLIMTNTGWTTSGNTAAIIAAAARSGAFALGANSADSTILTTLAPGTYTAIMSGANGGTGVGLVEVYDLSTPTLGQKVIDIATRGFVGSGDNVLIAGVYVAGSVPKRVLVRAIGPGLIPLGVTGVLAQPQLTLYKGNVAIAQNADWRTSPDAAALAAASAQVAGLQLAQGSADAAMIVSLEPGFGYTAMVTGANGTTGVGMVEIYELP